MHRYPGRPPLEWTRRVCLLCIGLFVLAGAPGCTGSVRAGCGGAIGEAPDFGDFTQTPSVRIGSIPFPSLVSLYAEANPDDLGVHVYRVGAPFEGAGEAERGLLYTCRAGFLDLAHIRNTIDNTAHIHARLRYALLEGAPCVRYRVAEPSVYRVEIDYPAQWWAQGEDERTLRAEEIARRASEALGLHSMTWHEILTWFGYKSVVFISEKPSAFTYDDALSHAVGARVARRALHDVAAMGGGNDAEVFGAVVSVVLDETLTELGVVDPRTLREAVEAVNGDWWSGFSVKRRNVESGAGGEPMTPWLVPGIGACEGATEEQFRVARLDALDDDPATPRMRVLIDPRVLEESRIMRTIAEARGLEERPGEVDLAADFPVLLAAIRQELGDEAEQP